MRAAPRSSTRPPAIRSPAASISRSITPSRRPVARQATVERRDTLRLVAEGMPGTPELNDETEFARERFLMRARALFYARIALLTMGLAILLVPEWKRIVQVTSVTPILIYVAMVAYSAATYLFVQHRRGP